jgi:hypothetical protein
VVGEIIDDHTVVGRALAVIEAVAACGPNATLSELATLTGIPKPTAVRQQQRQCRFSPSVSCGDDLTCSHLSHDECTAVCLTDRFVSYDGCWSRGLG